MKIGIVGHLGVVGTALAEGFKDTHEIVGYDMKEFIPNIAPLFDTEVIFVCVPTPTVNGQQKLDALDFTFQNFQGGSGGKQYTGVCVIKSSILPGTTEMLSAKYPALRIINNPEFLTARTANEDFRLQSMIFLGSTHLTNMDVVNRVYWKAGYRNVVYLKPKEAEMLKYMHNIFFASKISILNEMYEICQDIGVNYEKCIKNVGLATGWLNMKHTMVPGPDGQRGFGGACFPKDFEAFMCWTQDLNLPTLKAAYESNEARRATCQKDTTNDKHESQEGQPNNL